MSEPSIVPRGVEKTNLTVQESAQLAAQLLELIRGVYYERWQPANR